MLDVDLAEALPAAASVESGASVPQTARVAGATNAPASQGRARAASVRRTVKPVAAPVPGAEDDSAEDDSAEDDSAEDDSAALPDGSSGAGESLGSESTGEMGSGVHAPVEHANHAHGPRLRTRQLCPGVFPTDARDDIGVVTLALQVGQGGGARATRILEERPRGQGFARAALSCVPRLSFDPATNPDGTRIAAVSKVRLRFVRTF
jgi:hypothetical protein